MRHLALTFLTTLMSSLISMSWAWALTTPVQVKPGKASAPIQSGVTIGGQATDELSLLSVRNEPAAASAGERFTISFGDRFGKPLSGEPGFFHVALDRDAKRIVIDLAQIRKTAVDAPTLARLLSGSKFVASSDITMDPFDGSTNITLILRQPVKLKVSPETQGQSRIQLELEPVATEVRK